MTKQRNNKITNSQFILCILIVLIHSSCLFMHVPGNPELQMVFGTNWASFVQLFIGEGICRIAVPLFMVISGYLFYLTFDGSWKSYGSKLKRRIFSLVIPYLFWSTLTFVAFFCAQRFLGLGEFFATRNGTEIDLWYFFDNIVLNSYDSPLWFCRYLIVLALLSIIVYWPLKKCPVVLFIVLLYLWLFNGNFFAFSLPNLRYDSIFFYFFGALIAIHKDFFIKIHQRINKPIIIISAVLYLIGLSVRTYLFCNQDPNYLLVGDSNVMLDVTQKILIPLGMFGFWYTYDYLFRNRIDLWRISKYSFLVFAAHHPVVSVIKKLAFRFIEYNYINSVLVYFVSAGITIAAIIIIGKLIHRFVPPLWKVATGNR